MKRPSFANEHIYHIYNRGVEKRDIFSNKNDYFRFILNLHEFNSSSPALNFGYQIKHTPIEVRLQYTIARPLVEILTFCLMPNHYHLMIRQISEHGITEFMRKVGVGYTNYFNLRNQRVGPLFQGKFKAVLIENEEHFFHLPHYIHLNPLGLFSSAKKSSTENYTNTAMEFLHTYRWSSFQDYTGKENFPALLKKDFLESCVGTPEEFLATTREWLQNEHTIQIESVKID